MRQHRNRTAISSGGTRRRPAWTAAILLALAAAAPGGLRITDMGGRKDADYAPDPVRVPIFQAAYGTGGNTSVRNNGAKVLARYWKDDPEDGYYQRNRDLGQVFTAETTFKLDAIVLRTGPADGAVRSGAPGAAMFLQLFRVTGEPKLNDNGTRGADRAEHGFNLAFSRLDDYIEGVEYESIAVLTGGRFPGFPVTRGPEGDPSGQRRWMRWDLTGEHDGMLCEAGKRYAFLVGFAEPCTTPGRNRAFTLLNNNRATSNSRPPSLTDAINPYHGGWGIRREGDGTLPPWRWTVKGIDKGEPNDPAADARALARPPDGADRRTALRQSLFPDGRGHYRLPPSSDGWPDVDTYRDHVFYIEIAPDHSIPASRDACVQRGKAGGADADAPRLGARTDKARKTWLAFDLSPLGARETIRAAELVLTPAEPVENVQAGSTLEVHALTAPAEEDWPEALRFAAAPGNAPSSGWKLRAGKTTRLASVAVPRIGRDEIGLRTVRIELDAGAVDADGDGKVTLIVVMKDTATPAAARSTVWFHSRDAPGAPAPTLNLITAGASSGAGGKVGGDR